MYDKDECIRCLIVRSPSDQSPVDFNINLNIEAKDYDKVHIQLLSVNIDQTNTGSFPVDATNEVKTICFTLESNMGQLVFDTNQKKNFLGTVNVNREFSNPTSNDSTQNPLIELSRIPNGLYNFSLRDINGNIPNIYHAPGSSSVKGITYVFQLYFSKNELKRKQFG